MRLSNPHVLLTCMATIALSACSGSSLSPTPNAQAAGARSAVRSPLSASCYGPITPVEAGQGGDFGPFTYAHLGGGDHLSIDSHGCDIGIYVPPGTTATIDHTDIHDANKYGVFVDDLATKVTIDHTTIEKIGNHVSGTFSPNGVQTGDGIWFSKSPGTIDHTDVSQYQKNGFSMRNGSSVSLQHSSATGLGPVNFIAQNGIEYVSSTAPTIEQNMAQNNYYTGSSTDATGYLFECTNIVSAQQLQNQHNSASNNNINYYVDNTSC